MGWVFTYNVVGAILSKTASIVARRTGRDLVRAMLLATSASSNGENGIANAVGFATLGGLSES